MPGKKQKQTIRPEVKQYVQGGGSFDFKNEKGSLSVTGADSNEVYSILTVLVKCPTISEFLCFKEGEEIKLGNNGVV